MPEYTAGAADEVLSEGEYDFEVVDACEKESKTKNDMIELRLSASHGTRKVTVIDHLVFVPTSYWKIDAFRECTGEKLIPGAKVLFEADDCIDRKGRVHLIIDSYNGRSQNKVGEYLKPEPQKETAPKSYTYNPPPSQTSSPPSGSQEEPDDINF
jgi:hypothetical protein